jgi:hypothetical protein
MGTLKLMTVTYTNRKGRTYYLCERKTKTGKTRFVFMRKPEGKVVAEIPKGYEITESVNGVVSLSKTDSRSIQPGEVDAVREVVAAHPHLSRCKVGANKKSIMVYEPVTPYRGGPIQLAGLPAPGADGINDGLRYQAVLRFELWDKIHRMFVVQRMCHLSAFDDWMTLEGPAEIEGLAERYVKHVGRESFFELF